MLHEHVFTKTASVLQVTFALVCCCTSHWCVAAHLTALWYAPLQAAIAEAGFMTGMERNSLQVAMAAFAPLLSHWNDRACPHNMIIFDNHRYTHTYVHTHTRHSHSTPACVQWHILLHAQMAQICRCSPARHGEHLLVCLHCCTFWHSASVVTTLARTN